MKYQLVGDENVSNIKIDNVETFCLMDTGSVISTVSEEFYRQYLESTEIQPLTDFVGKFESATGDGLSYLGYLKCTIELNKRIISVLMLVTPTTNYSRRVPVLIGTNILRFFSPREIYHDCSLKEAVRECNNIIHNVGLVKTCNYIQTIEANSVMLIQGQVSLKKVTNFSRDTICTPIKNQITNSELMFDPIMVTIPANEKNVNLPIRVRNYTSKSIAINPRKAIYQISSPDQIINLSSSKHLDRISQILDQFNFEHMSTTDEIEIKKLIVEFEDVFALDDSELTGCTILEHKIQVNDNTPFKEKYRRIPPSMYDDVKAQLREMLAAGVISESKSPYSSTITVVTKKDGKPRICVDFRKLNIRTKKDAKSLPRIEDTLDLLKDATVFSSLDLRAGYWQIPVEKNSRELTAFTAGPLGFFEYNRLPFGLCNSGATFQRMIETALKSILHTDCLAYIDDIVVYSKNFKEHLEKLRRVLQKLREKNLKLKPSKCNLMKTSITYLGHLISKEGVQKDPEKVSKIKEWPIPTNVRDVRRYLGFCSYFRKFIRDFAKISSPLSKLLQGYSNKKGKRRENKLKEEQLWIWGELEQEAFDKLKVELLTNVTLSFADFSKDFVIETDACKTGLGAILYQIHEGKKRPIAFASRKTSLSEQGYSTHRLEFLAMKWAVTDKFREYLYNGNKCHIFSDNNPLTYLMTKTKIDATTQRWCADLANYNITVTYKSGKENTAADLLSRDFELTNQQDDPNEIHRWCQDIRTPASTISEFQINSILSCHSIKPVNNVQIEKETGTNWVEIQEGDREIKFVKDMIKEDVFASKVDYYKFPLIIKQLLRQRRKLVVLDNILYLKKDDDKRIVISRTMTPTIMRYYHEQQGHLGEDRTLTLVKSRFYWPKMDSCIIEAVKRCKSCQLRKTLPAKNHAMMGHLQQPKHPFHIISIDHLAIDPRQHSRNKVLTVVDEYTKFAIFLHTKDETGKTTAQKLINEVFLRYGFPSSIHSDNGRAFVNRVMKSLRETFKIKHTTTLPHNPQGNATCERMNQTLLNMLGTLKTDEKANWKKHLLTVQYAYNSSIHSATGFSPFYLMFGRHPRLVGDIALGLNPQNGSKNTTIQDVKRSMESAFEQSRQTIEENNDRNEMYYNDKHKLSEPLNIGDIVVKKKLIRSSKIDNRWDNDLYRVVSETTDIPVYEIENVITKRREKQHRNHLLPLFGPVIVNVEPPKPPKKRENTNLDILELDEEQDDNDEDVEIIINPEPDSIVDSESEVDGSLESESNESSDSQEQELPRRIGRVRNPPNRFSPANYHSILPSQLIFN